VALKACTVVIHDLNKTEHALDVTAETLYEAVAQALAALRVNDWVGGDRMRAGEPQTEVFHPSPNTPSTASHFLP
jgi:hypothetical protein